MARFRFKFESLLRYRKLTEQQRQRELADQLRIKAQLEQNLRQAQDNITQTKQGMAAALSGQIELADVRQHARYSGHLTQQLYMIAQQLAAHERQVVAARQRLLDATRERKALELLRDRHLEEHRRLERRLENARLDELAVQAQARRILGMEA